MTYHPAHIGDLLLVALVLRAGSSECAGDTRRSTRQRKDVDYNEAHALVSLDDKGRGPATIDRASHNMLHCCSTPAKNT